TKEYVIFSAHWDHLGKHPELQGDHIFNGAVDNASGVAAVISLGRAFTKLNPLPKRTLLFLATTAEEAGLLGAKYYAMHPLYPLEKTLADINIDSMNVWGKARDIEDTSFGMSTLDDALARVAQVEGRTEFDLHDYHQVSDEVKPDWDLSGAVQDAQLLFVVGDEVANGDKFPQWKAGNEFKPKRDAMMRKP
ncbi:MAG: peptidase M28, partial [Verrucomicrobia bacterium]